MTFFKPTLQPAVTTFKAIPFVKDMKQRDLMQTIARWHNAHGSVALDRRDRQRHFAIAKSIEMHYGQS